MSAGFLECLRQLTELRRKDMALRDAAITLLDSRSVVSGDGLCLVPASRLDALRAALHGVCACTTACVDPERQNSNECRVRLGSLNPNSDASIWSRFDRGDGGLETP